ncbi:MAG TPA: hypothetical protein ENJ30_02005 [Desulfobulbaceae bacterium]|nr:hypothetical protein [Desulfobulbaceae bacterium]
MNTRMKGWKTWAGVLGLVITQLVKIYFPHVDMDAAGATAGTLVNAVQAVSAGLTVVGVAHKIEKAKV